MATLPGLFQRGGVWWLRVMVPIDLRPAVGGRDKVVRSLNTPDRRQASRLALTRRAALLSAFEDGSLDSVRESKASPPLLPASTDVPPAAAQPPAPAGKVTDSGRGLRDVFTLWKTSKKRTDDAISACTRALEAFETVAGRPALSAIKREDGATFRAALLVQPISSKTAHDRLTWVKSLLRFAYRDLEWLDRQPWEGLDLAHKTESPRKPWKPSEVAAFFSSPVQTTYTLPTVVDAAGPAAYWIPLLGLYSGARIGELCQLRVPDITTDSAGPVFNISEAAEGARVKSAAGTRVVPVHSELVRLGFLDYVRRLTLAGEKALWPAMRFRKGKPGANFSQWFSTARATCPGGAPDFHSLRHTVRTKLAEAGISDRVKDRITGHAVQGSTGTRVYEHATPAELRRAVESITYPGFRLPRVYPDLD